MAEVLPDDGVTAEGETAVVFSVSQTRAEEGEVTQMRGWLRLLRDPSRVFYFF